MRKFLLATVALSALSFQATAADLPVRGPAMAPAPMFVAMNWTGFYVGAQVGYSWGNHRISRLDATGAVRVFGGFPLSDENDVDGFVGGLHVGYNYQTGSFVFGIEADGEFSDAKYSRGLVRGAPGVDFNYGSKDWQASLRARAGLTFGNALLYVTGGLAIADVNSRVDVGGVLFTAYSKTKTGYTVGAGVEYALSSNWSARAEYRYTDLGSIRSPSPGGVTVTFRTDELVDHTLRLGVSYRFGSPSRAVVARY